MTIKGGRSRREATTDEKIQEAGLRSKRQSRADVTSHVADSDPHTVYQLKAQKDQALGYAGLDAGNRVPIARLPPLIGDSGSGGTAGIAPAPGAGDAAAGKFLKADGTWVAPGGGAPASHASSHALAGSDPVTLSASQVEVPEVGTATYDDLGDWFRYAGSAGHLTGGDITDNGDGTVSVTACLGYVRTGSGSTDSLRAVNFPAPSALAVTDGTVRYVVCEYNGGTPRIVLYALESYDYNSAFPVGIVARQGSTIYVSDVPHSVGDAVGHLSQRTWEVGGRQRAANLGGLVLSSPSGRTVAVTSGVTWLRATRESFAGIDTSVSGSFSRYYRDGAGGWTTVAGQTAVQNSQYDDGTGTLATLSGQNYVCEWVYLGPEGGIATVLGRASHANVASAQAEGVPATLPPRLQAVGLLLGRTITRASASTPTLVESAFAVAFAASAAASHANLADLSWTGSGHTATADRMAGFDGAGAAEATTVGAGLTHSGGSLSVAYGTSGSTACVGNDSRLSDSRAPNGSASGDLGGTYPSPTVTHARGLRETTGPTTLSMGSVYDGSMLVRSLSTVSGVGLGNWRAAVLGNGTNYEGIGRAGPSVLGTGGATAVWAKGRRFRSVGTGAGANTTAGWQATSSAFYTSDLEPTWECELKTASDLTSIRLYCGMTDTLPSTTTDDYGVSANVVCVRYCPGSDTYWTLYTQAGATGTINKVATSLTPATDTVYRFRLALTATSATLYADVGGTGTYTQVATTSTSIPGAGTAMGDIMRLSNTVASVRTIITGYAVAWWAP